jgi:hypothetical protein
MALPSPRSLRPRTSTATTRTTAQLPAQCPSPSRRPRPLSPSRFSPRMCHPPTSPPWPRSRPTRRWATPPPLRRFQHLRPPHPRRHSHPCRHRRTPRRTAREPRPGRRYCAFDRLRCTSSAQSTVTAPQFPVFERFRSALLERRRRETGREITLVEHGLVTAAAAGSAGALAAAVTTPVDVIKTRIMLAAGDGARRGSMAFARDILQDQGWRELFRGGALRCVSGAGCTWACMRVHGCI